MYLFIPKKVYTATQIELTGDMIYRLFIILETYTNL